MITTTFEIFVSAWVTLFRTGKDVLQAESDTKKKIVSTAHTLFIHVT